MSVNVELAMKPLGDRLIVRVEPEETKTSAGIYIPDTEGSNSKPQIGEVLAVGRGTRLDNGSYADMEMQVGNKVIFNKYAGTEIKSLQEGCLVLREDDVMAIVE
ncbi:MAG TPA: co-chaperone GroES [Gammaproteobacteria bacterium]|nr:co-chaperone GroES [Gammaproteobacteria bacterium]